MKQNTTKQPLEDSKEYVITENLADHVGYNGEPVTIFKRLPDDYYLVRNSKGKLWNVGEEEIKEYSKEGLHTQKWQADGRAVIIPGTFPEVEICVCTSDDEVTEEQAYANAELIVKAVNERRALLDSHRELLDIVKRLDYWHHLEDGVFSYTDPKVDGDELTIQLQNAINNAKNI